MVDQEQPEEFIGPRGLVPKRFANFVKSWLKWKSPRVDNFIQRITRGRFRSRSFDQRVQRFTGANLQYEYRKGQDILNIQTLRQDLIRKGLLELLRSRNIEVSTIEKMWDNAEDILFGKWEKGQHQYGDGIEDQYVEGRIYLDPETANYEWALNERGPRQAQGDDIKNYFEYNNIRIGEKTYWYPLPPRTKIRYPVSGMKRNWIVEVSPFGYENDQTYSDEYSNLVEKICEDYKVEILSRTSIDSDKKEITKDINALKNIYMAAIKSIVTGYTKRSRAEGGLKTIPSIGIEDQYRGFIKGPSDSVKNLAGYAEAIIKHKNQIFRRDNMVYYNTYQIINPVIYGSRETSGVVQDRLNDPQYAWDVRGEELGPGLDKWGYPLEVDENGRVMNDAENYPGLLPRQVPKDFIKQLDLLEMANYIVNMHDTYRDDLRDGRYHPNPTTIMDYVKAKNRSIWRLWEVGDEEDITTQQTINIRLQRPVDGRNSYEYGSKPTDKDPAFDVRAITRKGAWKHAGKKYYYGVPDDTKSGKNTEVHTSSRGVSMYIVEKITRELYWWNQIKALSDFISAQYGGYDYGPRPWEMMWGKPFGRSMPKSIYNWREILTEINKPIAVYLDAAGFQRLEGFKVKRLGE